MVEVPVPHASGCAERRRSKKRANGGPRHQRLDSNAVQAPVGPPDAHAAAVSVIISGSAAAAPHDQSLKSPESDTPPRCQRRAAAGGGGTSSRVAHGADGGVDEAARL